MHSLITSTDTDNDTEPYRSFINFVSYINIKNHLASSEGDQSGKSNESQSSNKSSMGSVSWQWFVDLYILYGNSAFNNSVTLNI
jgi:hypothetical protein